MLSKEEFNILYYLVKNPNVSEKKIAESLDLSMTEINYLISFLKRQSYLSEDRKITVNGYSALEPYKVKNAIILAAGFASRCAPLSYERPKGLFIIKGEILIERQIKQLLDKGITEIYVVVGYKKELFFI